MGMPAVLKSSAIHVMPTVLKSSAMVVPTLGLAFAREDAVCVSRYAYVRRGDRIATL